ncbi:MAG: HAMP domain-containing histidine kinase [Clostridioides sp.]|nr:HAMP domain-containing histidine kinase [Clostridioides sp.]
MIGKNESEKNINIAIKESLEAKHIYPTKLWIRKSYIDKLDDHSINKIYNQEKSKYSILIKFIKIDDRLICLVTTIEHSSETMKIVNKLNLIIGAFSVMLTIGIVFILSNSMINPIKSLQHLSEDISRLNFRTELIKTGDEIEDLANSINKMSLELERAHKELNNKNEMLKKFISDITHELKTPISIIKSYSIGIQEDLDDGTYIETIINQTYDMSDMINKLIYWLKSEKKESKLSQVNLGEMVLQAVRRYKGIIEREGIELNVSLNKGGMRYKLDEFYVFKEYNESNEKGVSFE